MKKCFVETHYGRNTPCHFGCTDVCKRFLGNRDRGGPFFLPSSLPNLAAWFRYGSGITSAVTLVSQWDDASGNGRHLKQTTDTNKPALQGDGSILFPGTDEFLKCDAFTLNQPETVYILGKQITYTMGDCLCDGNTTGTGQIRQETNSPELSIRAGNTVATNANLVLDTYGVAAAVFNGASSLLQINNTAATTGNAGAGNMGGFALGSNGAGGSAWAHIQVKEVIIYAAAHDAATRAQVIAYLAGVGNLSL